jgi:hypothetical protein
MTGARATTPGDRLGGDVTGASSASGSGWSVTAVLSSTTCP